MKQLIRKVLESKKTTIVLLILLFILLILLFIINFETIANYFYGDENLSNKGQLLGTALTAIGGICVIWGLYLNNKKVAEQTRQNDIAVQNSNDKRFGEAIGYLNDNNEGIAIGGAYALYQLAKEDSRYAPIITDIFYSYVNDNKDKKEKNSYQTILSLLFSKDNPFEFNKIQIFRNLEFKNNILYCKQLGIKFIECTFYSTVILDGDKIEFRNCSISSSVIIDFSSVFVSGSNCYRIKIISNKHSDIHFGNSVLRSSEIIVGKIKSLILFFSSISKMTVYSDYIKKVVIDGIKEETLSSDLVIHYVSGIKTMSVNGDSNIDRNQLNIVRDSVMKSDNTYRQIAGL